MKKAISKKIYICVFILFFLIAGSGLAQNLTIHPSFKNLLLMYPRSVPIVNPEVPRISPKMALSYYGSSRAIFIAAGGGAVEAGLPGSITLTESLTKNPSTLLRFKDKLIIIFCH